MTVDLEERIRINLRERAERIHVRVPDPSTNPRWVSTSASRSRRAEVVAVAAALVLFVGAGLVIALAGREGTEPVTAVPATAVPATVASVPTAPVAGELGRSVAPGALIAMPAPWHLDQFTYSSRASVMQERAGVLDGSEEGVIAPAAMVEYRFGDGARTLQIDFYELGVRQPTVTTPEPPLVEVRGTTGWFLDYGDGRYRVQWDEGGRTWEIDGRGFASLDDLVGALATIQWEDDTTWATGAPTDLVAALAARPDGRLSWSADLGVVG